MKKLTRRGFTAAAILGIFGMGIDSCAARFSPSDNEIQTVYGPPPSDPAPFEPKNNENVDVYGPPADFEPDLNQNICVYDPPESFQ